MNRFFNNFLAFTIMRKFHSRKL